MDSGLGTPEKWTEPPKQTSPNGENMAKRIRQTTLAVPPPVVLPVPHHLVAQHPTAPVMPVRHLYPQLTNFHTTTVQSIATGSAAS